MTAMRVLLVAGGWSDERQVSLAGAEQIAAALERLGHTVRRHDLGPDFTTLLEAAAGCDCACINLHGAPGEDGLVQAALEAVGLPYQGSGPRASFLALNKALSKALYRRTGLSTPDWELFVHEPPADRAAATFAPSVSVDAPVFVKPNLGGSSLGMVRAVHADEVAPAVRALLREGREALVERGVDGVEVTCAVMGNPGAEETLPPIMIRPRPGSTFFDYVNKYDPHGAEEICPAPIAPDEEAAVREAALVAHRALGCAGVSRSDFLLRDGVPWILETNTLPGMAPTSLLPRAAAAAGLSFEALVQRLLDLALERHRKRQGGRHGEPAR